LLRGVSRIFEPVILSDESAATDEESKDLRLFWGSPWRTKHASWDDSNSPYITRDRDESAEVTIWGAMSEDPLEMLESGAIKLLNSDRYVDLSEISEPNKRVLNSLRIIVEEAIVNEAAVVSSGRPELASAIILHTHAKIVIMSSCKLSSKQRAATRACAVLPRPGIVA